MNRTFYIDDLNKTINLKFDYNTDVINGIKECDYNTRFNPEYKEWIIPVNDWSKPKILSLVKRFDFKQVVKEEEQEVVADYTRSKVDLAYVKGLCDSKGFTYTARDYQLECLAYSMEKGNVLNGDDVGLGKCEYVENLVFTPNGRKRIGDIVVGDSVIGSNGKGTLVTEVHPQKEEKALYRVSFNDGFSVLVTKDHLFDVTSSRGIVGGTAYNTLSVEQMLDKNLKIVKKGIGHNSNKEYSLSTYYKLNNGSNKWQIPIVKPMVFENSVDLPISPYLFGFLLGDGHFEKSGRIYAEIHKDDFDEVFAGCDYDEICGKNNTRKASFKRFKESALSLGVNGKLSYNKFIPDIYKYASIDERCELIRGLMDSDGYASKDGGASFCTSSKRLLDDFSEVVHSLGGIVRNSKGSYKKYTHNGIKMISKHLSYRSSVRLPNNLNPFKIDRKANLYKPNLKYKVCRYIKDISFEKYGDSVCISVEADDSLYATEHGIVTHNTFEAILYAETSNSFPCLVVVPASVKYNWKEKWEEITGNKRSVAVIESKETKKHKNDWNADVVIINYDIIGKKQGTGATVKFDELVDKDWNMVVFDEGHFLKNKKSQRAKASLKISKNTDGKIQILTGTAIMSKPVEIWNLLVVLKMDKLIAKDWHQFVHRYCGAYRGKFGLVTDGATNILELNRVLRDSCYIRREKEDVLDELPAMIEQVIQMPIANKKAIEKATDDFINYITETKGEEAADKAMAAEHLVALGVLRKLAVEGKLKAIEQWLKDWKECYPDKKVVIFGVHREPLEKLSEKFKSLIINGGVSSKRKQEIVKEWCSNDDTFLFANIDAAGTGVDGLQKVCSNMLIIELPWRTSDLVQVKGRLHRSGQKEPPNINYMLSDETIDTQMWDMLSEKERVTEAVNKGIDVKKQGSGMRAVIKKILKFKK